MGEARDGVDIIGRLARRMGYDLNHGHAAQVMSEIARLVPGYRGIGYARLERGGMTVPNRAIGEDGVEILHSNGASDPGGLTPSLVPVEPAVVGIAGGSDGERGSLHV
jgi:predicted molibdopterin-dependent oxidoreductase YjgC